MSWISTYSLMGRHVAKVLTVAPCTPVFNTKLHSHWSYNVKINQWTRTMYIWQVIKKFGVRKTMLIVIVSELIIVEFKLAYIYVEYSQKSLLSKYLGDVTIKFENFFSEVFWTSLFLLVVPCDLYSWWWGNQRIFSQDNGFPFFYQQFLPTFIMFNYSQVICGNIPSTSTESFWNFIQVFYILLGQLRHLNLALFFKIN